MPSYRSGLFQSPMMKSFSEPALDSEEEEDSDNSLTLDLEKVGRSVSFAIPSLPSFKLFTYNDDESISDFFLDQQLTQIFNKRRDQLTDFINDLTTGFSIQNAAERLQLLRDVVQNTVELPVSSDDDDEESTEPHGVVPAVEKQYPIIDELIIPAKKRSKSINKFDHLTNLTGEEFQDESLLRSRIKKIMSLPITDIQKNRLIQKLMMRSYYEKIKHATLTDKNAKKLQMHLKLQEESSSEDSDVSSSDDDEDEVVLTSDDLKPSYHSDDVLGCQHYQRNCKIECSICNKWYTCRFCHDSEITDHQLIRNQIRHVLCMHCQTPQLPSQICINEECGKILSHYYCDKCKLFDNDLLKDIYHCDDCGICRLGQGLNQDFFHCKGCNACISIDLQDHHKCIENSTHSNCTICGEYMFSSIKTVVFMQCGHPIHQSCFDEYTKHSYKCPVCSRSIINMEAQFRVLDQEISLQPLPEPYGLWKCIVQCNDCKAKSMVKYHILGLKCENCKSYNTSQLKVLKNEKELQEMANRIEEGEHLKFPIEIIEDETDEDETLGNLINNDTLTSFDKYKEWFFSTMDSYLTGSKSDDNDDDDDDDDIDDYEEDDYDDMR